MGPSALLWRGDLAVEPASFAEALTALVAIVLMDEDGEMRELAIEEM